MAPQIYENTPVQRSLFLNFRRKLARGFATCAMCSWVLLAAIPIIIILLELKR